MPQKKSKPKRIRLDPGERRGQLLEIASRLVLKHGFLPLSLVELSRAAGVSKGLIYTYFPTQHALFNALLLGRLQELNAAGLERASRQRKLEDAAKECADIYFSHVAASGPLIHFILRDRYMAGHIDQEVRRIRNSIVRHLSRLGGKRLRLNAKEAIAAFNLILTIPEEAGRLVFDGSLSLERGRSLCQRLLASTLVSIAPVPK